MISTPTRRLGRYWRADGGYIGSWEGNAGQVLAPDHGDSRGYYRGNRTLQTIGAGAVGITYPCLANSAHSVEGGAAAGYKRFFGTDRFRFRAGSMTLPAGKKCWRRQAALVPQLH